MYCYPNKYNVNENYYGNGYNNRPIRRAMAQVVGGPLAPNIRGTVIFEETPGGTLVSAEFYGLPTYKPASNGNAPVGPLGFHLHENGTCDVGNEEKPFEAAGGHWNPTSQPHGNHAGDFPVIFSNNGYARMEFFTNKFKVDQVIGKTVIIHENPDDYRTQPAGAAGRRIACGVVQS